MLIKLMKDTASTMKKSKYFYLKMSVYGSDELIIRPIKDLDEKIKYIEGAYDLESDKMRFNENISLVGFGTFNEFAQLEKLELGF